MQEVELEELEEQDIIKVDDGEVGAAVVMETGFNSHIGTYEITGLEDDKLMINAGKEVLYPPEEVLGKITAEEAMEIFKEEK